MPGYDNPQTPGTPASGHYGSYDQPGSQQALNDQDGQYYHFSDKEAGAGAGVSKLEAAPLVSSFMLTRYSFHAAGCWRGRSKG